MFKLFALSSITGGGVFLAQTAAPELPNWVNWGVLGLVILALVTKQLVPGPIYKEAKDELRELKVENKELTKTVLETQGGVLPVLENATSAIREALTEIRILRKAG